MSFFYKMKNICKYTPFLICLLISTPSYAQNSKKSVLTVQTAKTVQTAQKKSAKLKISKSKKIKVQAKPSPSLDATIRKMDTHINKMTDVFTSTLFTNDSKKDNNTNSALIWLHDSDFLKNRDKIINTRPPKFEFWWKYRLASSHIDSSDAPQSIAFLDLDAKVLSQWSSILYGQAELELKIAAGSKSENGDKASITGKEIALLWKTSPWLTLKTGIISQTFLKAPLLIEEDSSKPFVGIVGNIHLFKKDRHAVSMNIQGAVPENSVQDEDYLRHFFELETPLFFTQSTLWHYDPKSYYKIDSHLTGFCFFKLNNSTIPENSLGFGNTPTEDYTSFEYDYCGLYAGIEPSFKIFTNLKLNLKFHYINNMGVFFTNLKMKKSEKPKDLHQGSLISISTPLDMTENLRITPKIEYFVIQPDATIGYYGTENYGYTNRYGFLGEIITNIYTINMEIGLRFIWSRPVNPNSDERPGQSNWLIFARSHYARI